MKKEKKSFLWMIKNNRVTDIAFVLALMGISLTVFLGLIGSKYLNIKIIMIVLGISLLLWFLLILFAAKKPKTSVFVNLLLVVALSLSSLVALRLSGFSGAITNHSDIDTVSIITRTDSELTTESDLFGMKLATFLDDENYNNWAISLLQDAKKYTGVNLVQYATHLDGFKALLNGEVDMMVLSADAESEIIETEEVLSSKEYKVIYTDSINIETEQLPTVDVAKNGFTVLINGIDLSGNDINKKARADINILATINPSTGKINLQVLPRDLWVELPCKDNLKTKLNRSGSQGGSGCTIDAIEQYFDHELEINYYAKINFTGFVDLVDALGGIEAYSYYTFCALENGGYEYCFKKGMNKLDGEKALVFARVRKILPGNDVARGNHQLEIIKGILNKFLKDPSIEKMNKLLNAVEGNFVTTFEEKQFISLFELLLNIKDNMVIESNSMKGGIEWAFDPIYKEDLYYFVPDDGQKELALQRIKDTLEGK